MISKQMDRSEVAVAVGVEKKNVGPVIKEMKAAGRLVEVRPTSRRILIRSAQSGLCLSQPRTICLLPALKRWAE